MGTLSGDGYYQDKDEAMDYDDHEANQEAFEKSVHESMLQHYENGRAQVGATISCACCGRLVVKKTYQQRFCPPVGKGKNKKYKCKDRYNNIVNPRGKFAHLA